MRWQAIAKAWLLVFLLTFSGQARAGIDVGQYQLPMAPAPLSVEQAITTLPARQMLVIVAKACGSEVEFNTHLLGGDNGEGLSSEILGKLAWFQKTPGLPLARSVMRPACQVKVTVNPGQLCGVFEASCRDKDAEVRDEAAKAFIDNPRWAELTNWSGSTYDPDVEPLRAAILAGSPEKCQDSPDGRPYSISASVPPGTKPPDDPSQPYDPKVTKVRLTFTIAADCIIAQANQAIATMARGDIQVGTTGAPCFGFFGGTTEGEWDATLKDLIRVAELDRRTPTLDDEARRKLNEELIDIDGGPAQESYHLWECGNEERSVGSPQERSDARDGIDGFLDDLADTFEDLFWLLLVMLVIAALVVAAIVATTGVSAAVVAGSAAVTIATVAIAGAALTVPETENHLLMINSTKFLNNQHLMKNGATGYGSDQSDLKDWLLEQMQDIVKSDFLEYNSRPYQRYSQAALLNLADFAEDSDVREGARLVLEYQMAKYSLTSSEGRRIAPFRRKRSDLKRVDGVVRDGTSPAVTANGLFDFSGGADYMHALGLLYYGMSLNLLEFDGQTYAASRSWPASAIYAATSDYVPDIVTFSLAMERQVSPLIHQRIHHHGWEIVSSGAAFTITAGGLTTGMPKNMTIDLIDQLKSGDDLGVAVPTVLMLTGRPHMPPTFTAAEQSRPPSERRSELGQFLRFEGQRPDDDDSDPSYDYNLCVWDGFACGANMVVPADLRPCMVPAPRANWWFVRSDAQACTGYRNGPRFWMAVYERPLPNQWLFNFGEVASVGFIEVVDASEMSFGTFRSRVLSRNPGPDAPIGLYPLGGAGGPMGSFCNGVYVSARGAGQRIEFDCEQVIAVDGAEQADPDDWPLAGSPPGALGQAPMQSSGNGRIEITSLARKRKVILEFQVRDNPMFQVATLP